MPSTLGIVASGVFTPLKLSPVLWLDAADTTTITASSGSVSQWNDKSGNALHVSQGVGANRPTTGTRTLNGKNVLDFEGNNWLAASSAADWKFLHDGTLYLIAAVVKFGNDASVEDTNTLVGTGLATGAGPGVSFRHDNLVGGRTGSLRHLVTFSSITLRVNNSSADNTLPANSYQVVTLKADVGNATPANRSQMFVGGGGKIDNNTTDGAPSTSNPAQPLLVGLQAPGLHALTGQIAEIVVTSGASATESNRVLLRDYLTDKWGL